MIITRRDLLAGLAFGVLVGPRAAQAADAAPFDYPAFQTAQAAGKPILVHVTAPWCGTCQAQKPIIAEISARPEFSGLVRFEVDFDSQREIWESFAVQHQSTMIVFRGKAEMGRSVGDTRPDSIETLLRKAL